MAMVKDGMLRREVQARLRGDAAGRERKSCGLQEEIDHLQRQVEILGPRRTAA